MLKSFIKLLILSTSLFLLSDTSGAQISNPSGELNKTDPDRIWAQTLKGSHFNEFWNYQFYFDNGMKLHIVFSAANFGSLKSPVTGVRISALYPDGSLYQVSREYPIEHLLQDKESHKFQLRPDRDIYFEGKLPHNHRVVVNTSKDGVSYDINLNFENIVNGYQWDDGIFKIKNETIGIATHIPYAEVRGYVSVNNNRKQVKGTAYMDHTHQHQNTTRLMDSGFRFVHHTDRNNWDIIYALQPARGEANVIGYMLSNNQSTVKLSGIKNISTTAEGRAFGKTIPRILEVNLDNSRTLRIARTEDQERFSILSELSWVARRAARTFLGGEVVDFRGEATLIEPSYKPIHGDYNFFFIE